MKVICYLAGGYPTLPQSLAAAGWYAEGGCDAIEWSFPPRDPYLDPDYIAEKMRQAYAQCPDYTAHQGAVAAFRSKHPTTEIFLLLYQQTILEIGCEALLAFCKKNQISTIISADLRDAAAVQILTEGGLQIAVSVTYALTPAEIAAAQNSNGFVYMQAMPTPQDIAAGHGRDTLAAGIQMLRAAGIRRPIYCGVGIRSPQDVAFIHGCGGDGFFVGSGILQYYDNPTRLKEEIAAYKAAAQAADPTPKTKEHTP